MTIRTRALAGAPLALCACLTALPAHAEEAEDRAAIIVTGQREKQPDDTLRVPGGARTVASADFENKAAINLRDALATAPGVYLQPRYGQEVRISVRGSGLSRGYHVRGLTLLQDGIPINLADDNGDFQELDPMFLERIEVHRGANALRFGGSTLGGAVNGVTPTGGSAPGFFLRADGGSFGSYRGLVSFGHADTVADVWAAASHDSSNGDRDHARRSAFRFHGNVGLRLSEAVETRFYAGINNANQELPGTLTYDEARSNPRKGNFAGDQARDVDSIRLQNRTALTLGDAAAIEVGAFLNAKRLHHPIFQVIDQQSTDWGVFARAGLGSGPFEATIGSTARFGTVRSRRFVNIDGKRGAPTFRADQRARTIDLYGEARFTPIGGLSLIAGGVYTHGRRAQTQHLNGFAPPAAQFVEAEAAFEQFSPKLGLLWEPAAAVQLYANYSRSAEMPGFMELAQVAGFVPLAAQRAWTAEIGSRGTIGFARWDVSLYRAALRGELLQFTVNADIPASTFNAGRTLHQGIEAALDLAPVNWLRLRQTWLYSDFRFRGDAQYGGNRLPVIPRHVYRAELRIGTDGLHLAPNLEWVPQGGWADYRNTVRTPGYALIGVTAEAALRGGLSLFADARNLTGRKAIGDIAAVIDASTPAGQAIYYPVERRAVFAGVRARF